MEDKLGRLVTIGSQVISPYTGKEPVQVVAISPRNIFVRVRNRDGEDEWLMSRDMIVL
jgi:hypothetical protein